jgi:hypothetical protein
VDILYLSSRSTIVASWEEVEEVERPSYHQSKGMLTVFFNGMGVFFIKFLPEGQKMNSICNAQKILRSLSAICCPYRPKMAQRRVIVNVDNASMHNVDELRECLDECGLARMEHPACIPDLTLCDFILFGYFKGELSGHAFSEFGDLFQGVYEGLSGIRRETFDGGFEEWICRVAKHCKKRRISGVGINI